MFLAQFTGRGVRVAVIDSGVHASHPHVGGVAEGAGIAPDGSLTADFVDRLGHGTAVTAAIREKAPDAEIIVIKVFRESLATDAATLVRAMDEAVARRAQVINLSLGTADAAHRAALEAAVARASAAGALVVSAVWQDWLPGALDSVIGVRLDWESPRDAYRVVQEGNRRLVAASGYPRDAPGIPREKNLKGVSFAVANASAFVARAIEGVGRRGGLEAVLDTLAREAAV